MFLHIGELRSVVCIVFLTCSLSVWSTAAINTVHWYTSIDEASAQARRSNKPILVDFQANWCAACKVMETDVYTNASFMPAFARLELVKIDFDKDQAVAKRYDVTLLPTLIFTDSYGTELFRHSGYIGPKAMAELLASLPIDVTDFNRLSEILSKDKNDFEALEAMGRNLRTAGLFRVSNNYYARALQHLSAKSDSSGRREEILANMGVNSLELREGKEAAEKFEKCLAEFPESKNKSKWTLSLVQAYAIAGKKSKAKKLLEEFIQNHPEDTESEKIKVLFNSLYVSGISHQ